MARRKRQPVKIRSHLTLAGWLVAAMSIAVFVVSVSNQVAMLFVLFGCMMGALHVSVVIGRRMLGGVQLRREIPTRVWQNQTVHLGYYLRNIRRRGACLGVSIEEVAEGIECAAAFCVHVAPQSVFRAGGRFAAARRGRIAIKNVRLSTLFPLGLVKVKRIVPYAAELVVWPSLGRLKMQLLHLGAVELSQSAPSQATGGQDEFFGLREYRSDDNPRWIHWRRSASRPVPVVREMSRPLQEILWVLLDADAPGGADPLAAEKRIRLAATLVEHGLGKGHLVGLATTHGAQAVVINPGGGKGQQRRLLDALSDVPLAGNAPLKTALGAIDEHHFAGAVAVMVAASAGAPPPVPRGCRRLTVIHPGNIDAVYEDAAVPEAP